MGFRLFGRGKDDDGEASCSRCGRTLLAGEWTQRLVDDDGAETYLCSLCTGVSGGPDADASADTTFETTPAGDGKVRSTRSDSDAFWRALKEKDAEIERLEDRLARAEAEKQELTAELARLRGRDDVPQTAVVEPPSTALPSTEPREAAGRTDPGLGEKLRGAIETPVDATDTPVGAVVVPPVVTTPPDSVVPDVVVPAPPIPIAAVPEPATATPVAPAEAPAVATALGPDRESGAAPGPHVSDDELGASLTILQRGVDLLNVSAVPRRVVETSESLGIPTVHVGSEEADTLLVTFLWTMGWYQFRVELADGGRVTLAERGYEERPDLAPNATVRVDGTIQIAPAMIKQAATKAAGPRDEGPPAAPTTTSGTIISKSLMGQRTDDENVPPAWGTKNAPDFDWGR